MVATKLMASSELDVLPRKSADVINVNPENFQVGMRISCGDDIGTIRYIGEVEGYSGQWLGIDWDNPKRGKHNGTVGTNCYFVARHSTSGSFVRPQKVTSGITIDEALRWKYSGAFDEEEEKLIQENLESVSKTINAPFLELVGFNKLGNIQRMLRQEYLTFCTRYEVSGFSSDFKQLQVAGLRGLNINDSGDLHKFSQLCPNLRELDISKNLFTSWISIYDICGGLKNLTRLNVSENKLIIPEEIPNGILYQIKIVVCGQMELTWHQIVHLSQAWPNVEELRVPLNNITNLDTTYNINDIFPKLSSLFLQNNPISSWHEINKIGSLDSLRKLIVTECELTEIEFPDCAPTEKTNLFKNLQCLSIAENKINHWKSISELEKLRNLVELRCTKNPFDEGMNVATTFQLILARIGNLKNLNGTELTAEEKRGAEYDYLKKHAEEWIACQKDPTRLENFIKEHPRYPSLVEKYGSPEEMIHKSKTFSLSSNLLELEIVNTTTGQTIVKKVPPNMAVQKFITLLQRLFKLRSTPNLYYISAKDPSCERYIDNNLKDLRFYSLENGDKILIKE